MALLGKFFQKKEASSQSSNLVQEQVTSAHDFASRDKMPSGDEEKVEIDEVVEVEAVEEVGTEKASPFAAFGRQSLLVWGEKRDYHPGSFRQNVLQRFAWG